MVCVFNCGFHEFSGTDQVTIYFAMKLDVNPFICPFDSVNGLIKVGRSRKSKETHVEQKVISQIRHN